MSENTSISWTQSTWNPIRARVKKDAGAIAREKGYESLVNIITGVKSTGVPRVIPGETWGYHCELVSDGCGNCYACTLNGRTLPAWGTGLPYDRRSRDLVDIYVDDEELLKPLKWKRGRKIFVCSMTDLFAEFVSDEQIRRVFQAICECRGRHTFQILTKRIKRAVEWFKWARTVEPGWFTADGTLDLWNVWLGVSVEDQKTADARVPLLLQTPAAKLFVSYEPALGPVDFKSIPRCMDDNEPTRQQVDSGLGCHYLRHGAPGIDWIIVGGESGPGARPFDVQWARNTVEQCAAAGVACFVKQLGARPLFGPDMASVVYPRDLVKDRKGADPLEWPEDLRVQQFPESRP